MHIIINGRSFGDSFTTYIFLFRQLMEKAAPGSPSRVNIRKGGGWAKGGICLTDGKLVHHEPINHFANSNFP